MARGWSQDQPRVVFIPGVCYRIGVRSPLLSLVPSSSLRSRLEAEIRASADPGRAAAQISTWLDASSDRAEILRLLRCDSSRVAWLARVCAISSVWPERLTRNPELFFWLDAHRFERGIHKAHARAELDTLVSASSVTSARWRALRRWKQCELLRIAARDLTARADLVAITHELSVVADLVLDASLRLLSPSQTLPFSVIGMGKLGGDELNYCSDVDVLFVYGDESAANHSIFTRLAQRLVEAVSAPTADGLLFRMDLRLRPEGKTGPLARSAESYENYYAAWGLTWERMALLKARPVAGDDALGAEFIETIQPFRYPRTISHAALDEVAEQKSRLEEEIVGEDQLDRNVKLGRGGIREIEFIVQSLQLLHAGRNPFLQESHTLRALAALRRYSVLPDAEAEALDRSYRFFRAVEHRLQMEADAQTHIIPEDPISLRRLARSFGFSSAQKFLARRRDLASSVRAIFDRVLPRRRRRSRLQLQHWLDRLAQAPNFGHVPPETAIRLDAISPILFRLSRRLGDPDSALTRLAQYADSYGARSTLFETFAANPCRLESILRFFDASPWMAGIAIAHPDWLDDAMRSDVLRVIKTAKTIAAELKSFGAASHPGRIRLYWEAETLRIGLRDIVERRTLTELPQIWSDLSALTEGIIRFTWPRSPKMAVIALGKLGGQELGYCADADLMIVAEGSAARLRACESRVREWLAFLAETRGATAMFTVDLRLRPEGEKGALVTSLDQFRRYHRGRAEFWERQLLTRARFIAGNAPLGRQFTALAETIAFQRSLAPADLRIARAMRDRIVHERSKGDSDRDFKAGRGGLLDIEFAVQLALMAHAGRLSSLRSPSTLDSLGNFVKLKIFTRSVTESLRTGYLSLRNIECALCSHSGRKLSSLPGDHSSLAWLAARHHSRSSSAFLSSFQALRVSVRRSYGSVLRSLSAATKEFPPCA